MKCRKGNGKAPILSTIFMFLRCDLVENLKLRVSCGAVQLLSTRHQLSDDSVALYVACNQPMVACLAVSALLGSSEGSYGVDAFGS